MIPGKVHLPEYAFAAQLADVEVNKLTGEVRVLRVVAAHDVDALSTRDGQGPN